MINLMTIRRNIATVSALLFFINFSISSLQFTAASFAQEAGFSVVESQQDLDELPPPKLEEGSAASRIDSQSVLLPEPDELESISPAARDIQGVQTGSEKGVDILTRGPLHEAFATAHQSNPAPSPLIEKEPPATIEEVPPEFKPEGNNVIWIPGYWAWDDAQSDFIWISGVWRDVPPGRRWIPGYWEEATDENGFRWISGFWADESAQGIDYLPEPPVTLDNGPSVQSPTDDYFYVPGNWKNINGHFRWASGHWQPIVKNWIWIPARYVWTPRGCIYLTGYWDYEIEYRGTCFAPVYFQRPVYAAHHYTYTPSYSININIDFLTHLFVRPSCGHYYYGDWYGTNFSSFGYKPWVHFHSHHRHYDPLLAYYKCRPSLSNHRHSVVHYLAQQHNFYVHNFQYRPKPTYSAQCKFISNSKHHKHHLYAQRTNYVQNFKKLHREQTKHIHSHSLATSKHQSRSHKAGKEKNDLDRKNVKLHRIEKLERQRARKNAEALARLQRDRKNTEIKKVADIVEFKGLAENRNRSHKLRFPELSETNQAKKHLPNREQLQRVIESARKNAASESRKLELERKQRQQAVKLESQRQQREKQRQARLQQNQNIRELNQNRDVTKTRTRNNIEPAASQQNAHSELLKRRQEKARQQQQAAVKKRIQQERLDQLKNKRQLAQQSQIREQRNNRLAQQNQRQQVKKFNAQQLHKQQRRSELARRQQEKLQQAQQKSVAQKRQQDQARRAQANAQRSLARQQQDQARQAQNQARRLSSQRAAAARQLQRQQQQKIRKAKK